MSPALSNILATFHPSFQPDSELVSLLETYVEGNDITVSDELFEKKVSHLTPFTVKVLRGVCAVRFGQTVTYGQLAAMLGCPKAIRAVASALGRNPLPIAVPCHRVIAANGPGGYAFGLEAKLMLLDFEAGKKKILMSSAMSAVVVCLPGLDIEVFQFDGSECADECRRQSCVCQQGNVQVDSCATNLIAV